MALPVQSYVWPRLRYVVATWIERVTGLPSNKVQYADQNQPSPELPYVGLTRRSWPDRDGSDATLIKEITTAVTLTVTASTPGETVRVILFGTPYAYTLQVGDGAAEARDALLALLEPDLIRTIENAATTREFAAGYQPCTATSSGPASIDFAGLGAGPVRLTVVEGATLSGEVLAYRNCRAGMRRALVRVELFWPEAHAAYESVDDYAEAIRSALDDEEEAVWLAQRGVGIEQGDRATIQDATAVSGALREPRLFVDVLFNARAKTYRDSASIDGVSFAVEVAA